MNFKSAILHLWSISSLSGLLPNAAGANQECVIWEQMGQSIKGEGDYDWDFSGSDVQISDDGTIVAFGAIYNWQSADAHVRVFKYNETADEWSKLGQDIDGAYPSSFTDSGVGLSADGTVVAGFTGGNGHIRVYDYEDDSWVQRGIDIEIEEFEGDVHLSGDGNTVVIGSPYYTESADYYYEGRVLVFQWSLTEMEWEQKGTNINGDTSESDQFPGFNDIFGREVVVNADGSIIAIGALGDPFSNGDVRVYTFDDNQGDWIQLGDDIAGDNFFDYHGEALAISDDGYTIAVGASGNDGDGTGYYAGHARVFTYSDGSWSQLGQDLNGEYGGDGFGETVSLTSDGRRIAVGGQLNYGNGANSGHVRILSYDEDSKLWIQQGGDINGGAEEARFGFGVALSGDGNIFASISSFNQMNTNAGAGVRVFKKTMGECPICLPDCDSNGVCTFKFKLNYGASELGYYTVDGCDGVQPTLGLKKDVTYKFVQEDISNYYHPLGFAYYTDGAHAGVDELEPGIVPPGSASSCGDNNSCPAPMYLLDDAYLGVYSNNDAIAPVAGDEDFGLDVYEPQFFATSVDWTEAGTYSVALKFDVDDFVDDIFYFCHIHAGMSGRIKWIDSAGNPLQEEDKPELDYEYEVPSEFDESCGTYGIGDYQLPNDECPSDFVCDSDSAFAGCVEAMNCRMTAGMTTNMHAGSAKALFSHQMIPHHRNAVNMAKALLASGELNCDDYTSESPDCILEQIVREIIPVQNHQIQGMQGALEELGYDEEDDCKVAIGGGGGGEFNIIHKNRKICVTHTDLAMNGSARLEKCSSKTLGQTWFMLPNGLIKNVDSKNCLYYNGKKVKVGKCAEVENRQIYMSGDGALAMSKEGSLMVVTPREGGGLLLKPRVPNLVKQEFEFKYL